MPKDDRVNLKHTLETSERAADLPATEAPPDLMAVVKDVQDRLTKLEQRNQQSPVDHRGGFQDLCHSGTQRWACGPLASDVANVDLWAVDPDFSSAVTPECNRVQGTCDLCQL